jgi:hypothetical protein
MKKERQSMKPQRSQRKTKNNDSGGWGYNPCDNAEKSATLTGLLQRTVESQAVFL